MHRMIPVAALALGLAGSAAAQDTTVRSKTQVSGDDARAIHARLVASSEDRIASSRSRTRP